MADKAWQRECGAIDMGSYGADYPCHLPAGHKGSHECLDKDDCPHHWDKPREFVQTPWQRERGGR